jgi:hypothetical protein
LKKKKKIDINDINPNPLSLNVEYAQELKNAIREKQVINEPEYKGQGQKYEKEN